MVLFYSRTRLHMITNNIKKQLCGSFLNKYKMSIIKKCHNHTLQTNRYLYHSIYFIITNLIISEIKTKIHLLVTKQCYSVSLRRFNVVLTLVRCKFSNLKAFEMQIYKWLKFDVKRKSYITFSLQKRVN